MKEKQIRVLRVKPNAKPLPADIENTLEALQEAVGGFIETVFITHSLVIVCNEEGKLKQLPPNRTMFWKFKGETASDTICGDFIVCGFKNAEFRSLTAREEWYLFQHFLTEEVDMTREGLKYL